MIFKVWGVQNPSKIDEKTMKKTSPEAWPQKHEKTWKMTPTGGQNPSKKHQQIDVNKNLIPIHIV